MELVGFQCLTQGCFSSAEVCQHGVWSWVSLTPMGHPAGPTWSDRQSRTSHCTCCLSPLCQGVSVGFIQLDGGADGQQNKMPHVPLFAEPLSHTMWFTNDWLWLPLCQRKPLEEEKNKRDIASVHLMVWYEVLYGALSNKKHFISAPSNPRVVFESAIAHFIWLNYKKNP